MCNWNGSKQLIDVQCNQILIFLFSQQKHLFSLLKIIEERGGSVVECLIRDLSLTFGNVFCPLARHFILCLVLVQPRKTLYDMTEKMLTGM